MRASPIQRGSAIGGSARASRDFVIQAAHPPPHPHPNPNPYSDPGAHPDPYPHPHPHADHPPRPPQVVGAHRSGVLHEILNAIHGEGMDVLECRVETDGDVDCNYFVVQSRGKQKVSARVP